jgi:hypothetical protein
MKQPKVLMTVSVPADVVRKLKERAVREGRSLSNLATLLLEKEVKKEAKAACTG